jgi:hypothetical protein
MLNDAHVRGEDSPEWQALLAGDFTFMLGGKAEAKVWKPTTKTLAEWLDFEDSSGRQKGLTAHHDDGQKDGKCIVTGASVGGARKAAAMDTLGAVGLDIDNGSDIADVLYEVEQRGLAALIYTTHSHLNDTLEPKRDLVLRKLGIDGDDLTDDALRTYYRDHDNHHYTASVLENLTIEDHDRLTADGSKIIARTIPIQKFRVIIFFADPVTRQMRGATDKERTANWAAAVKDLGATLGVRVDESAVDPSRLFYTPRHKPDAHFEMYLVRGRGLTWEEIQPKANPFLVAGAEEKEHKQFFTPSGASLKKWAATHGKGFQPASLLEGSEYDTGKGSGIFKDILCPFGDEHSKDEGGGFVKDADETGSWSWGCRHDSCNGRDKLEYVEKALADVWFEEDDIAADSFAIVLDDETIAELEASGSVGTASAVARVEDVPALDITAPLGSTLKAAVQSLDGMFAAVNLGGGLKFIRRPDHSIQNEENMEVWTKASLKEFYDNQPVKNGDKYVNPVDAFAKTAKRHSRVEFAPPGYDVPATTYNLFTGFSMKPVEGDCTILKNFIRDVICDGDEVTFEWLWLWMAHMMQRPGEKPGTAIVVHGEGGTGKGTFGELLHKLVHPYSMTAQQRDQVVGRFSGVALITAILCQAEEAFFAGDREAANTLKTKTTKEWEQVEPKGVQAFKAHSCTRYYIDSNHSDAVNIEGNGSERRFLVMQVSDARRGDVDYFHDIYSALEGPEISALAYELLQYDPASAGMKWRDVRVAPETRARQLMGYQSRSAVERALLDIFNEGGFTYAAERVEYVFSMDEPTRVGSAHLKGLLKNEGNKFHADDRDPMALMAAMFGNTLNVGRRKGVTAYAVDGVSETKNIHFFEFPPLREIYQAMFDKGYRHSPDPVEEVQEPEGAAYGPRR